MPKLLEKFLIGLIVIGLVLLVAIGGTVVAIPPFPLVAAEPMATPAPPDPPGKCVEWMWAGTRMIHKCVDVDEQIVCYQPAEGVLQCLPRN